MPTYEHSCTACGHRFDHDRAMAESAKPIRCPRCFGDAPRTFQGVQVKRTEDWSTENGGRGRQLYQLKDTYARHPSEVPTIAERNGCNAEKA